MKKILLIVLGLTIVGGIAYGVSSSGLLQGSFLNTKQLPTQNTEPVTSATTYPNLQQTTTFTPETEPATVATPQPNLQQTITLTPETEPATSAGSAGQLQSNPSTLGQLPTQELNTTALANTCSSLSVNSTAVSSTSEDFTVAVTLAQSTTWKGTLLITSNGTGTFTDSKGQTGSSLSLSATNTNTSFEVTYTGTNGDVITAKIKEEANLCNDQLTIKLTPSTNSTTTQTPGVTEGTQPSTQSGTLVCTGLNITPDTYTLSSGETSMKFSVVTTGTVQTSWKNLVKNLMAFTIAPSSSTSTVLGNLIIETDGAGTLSNNKNAETGTSINVPILTTSSTVQVTYKTPTGGETLKAYIKDQENLCTDSLTLTAAAIATTGETTTTTPLETTTTTTTDTTIEALSPDAATVIGDSAYTCESPFLDLDPSQWYSDTFCRMYEANVINGRTSTTAVADDHMTIAEAIKVLDLIAGYTSDDASGLTEDFLDVYDTDWFSGFVKIAQTHDMIRTRDAGLYLNPNNPISRGWFLLYAARLAGKTLTISESDIPFSDVKKDSPYAYAIVLAYNDGIVSGYSDGTFHPDVFLKRSEAVTLAQRLYLSDWFSTTK